ncbi:GNAT family N-acetyltransferase [Staphylospora marina]|uniref:GNAT family N-acetyltransferase n=1 Tax=Staphylospora marina TaxID=2490858 RepID=UPI000F5C25AB|nr:GNAT family N-acetyltransferase [Staphylospora marina]
MITIRRISPGELPKVRHVIVRFMKLHGDGRITHRALRWLSRLTPENVPEGTWIAAALEKNRLVGVIAFGRFGIDESFIAVHPSKRNQGVGEALLREAMNHLDKIYTRVACDNIPSLKLCFSCGLKAFNLFKGPTGKPTLWLGWGNYHPDEIKR